MSLTSTPHLDPWPRPPIFKLQVAHLLDFAASVHVHVQTFLGGAEFEELPQKYSFAFSQHLLKHICYTVIEFRILNALVLGERLAKVFTRVILALFASVCYQGN